MYSSMYKQSVLPARWQKHDPATGANLEIGFYESSFLGQAIKNAGSEYSNTNRGRATAQIIKNFLICREADHSGDPDPAQAAMLNGPANYYGDYIYNSWMGTHKEDGAGVPDPTSYPILKVGQVPANVIILMESVKPNLTFDGSTWTPAVLPVTGSPKYKYYFEKNNEIWTADVTQGQPSSAMIKQRIGTPHARGKKMNVLSADGHVSLVDPSIDFFRDPKDQKTVKDYMWNARDKYGTTPETRGHPGWSKYAPGL
jgi:prepilin-type processing-associated H-X9-DG protein